MPNASGTLGIDIGGANLKLATTSGQCRAAYFPLWSAHDRLAVRLRELAQALGSPLADYQQLAVTMTGEMADCFATRRDGVCAIVQHVTRAFPELPVSIYSVSGDWLSPAEACRDAWAVASSNWHALASWLARLPLPGGAVADLIVDIGSTTVDVIPLAGQRVATPARCDADRLRLQQLVYTGLSRTPIAAIVSQLQFAGANYPLVAEHFATSDDAYVALGLVPADPSPSEQSASGAEVCSTADGRPRTVPCARARLARMLGEDSERLTGGEIEALATEVVATQASQIAQAIASNLPARTGSTPVTILFSGHGGCLARAALQQLEVPCQSFHLSDLMSAECGRCAPAAAVAWLLAQREQQT